MLLKALWLHLSVPSSPGYIYDSKVNEISKDIKELKERVLTLEITDRIRQNFKTIKIQTIIMIVGFIGVSIALGKLLL